MSDLYTIGYANKKIEDFINLLKINNINCVIDVRSQTGSKQFPDYNEFSLKAKLKENGIMYGSYKKEFGARRTENEVYTKKTMYDGKRIEVVDFEKVYLTQDFQKGYERILNGLKQGYKIVFLCSEKHPQDCHRCIMVAEYFYRNNFSISHIVDENTMINHQEIDLVLEKNFNDVKKKQNISEEIQTSLDGFMLNENNQAYIYDWIYFFKDYCREKGLFLKNLEIGYKKGNDDYE